MVGNCTRVVLKDMNGLANVVTNSSSEYEIQFFKSSDVTSFSGGLYQFTNSPFSTIAVERPGGDTNKLRLTEITGGTERVFDYAWATNGWNLWSGDGLRLDTVTTEWSQTNTFTYTTNAYLETALNPDGGWEIYRYDAQNRPTPIFSSFLNQDPTTNAALCRLIEHDYSTSVVLGSGDDGTLGLATPRRTIEYLKERKSLAPRRSCSPVNAGRSGV